jgi:hypothetical protein
MGQFFWTVCLVSFALGLPNLFQVVLPKDLNIYKSQLIFGRFPPLSCIFFVSYLKLIKRTMM